MMNSCDVSSFKASHDRNKVYPKISVSKESLKESFGSPDKDVENQDNEGNSFARSKTTEVMSEFIEKKNERRDSKRRNSI